MTSKRQKFIDSKDPWEILDNPIFSGFTVRCSLAVAVDDQLPLNRTTNDEIWISAGPQLGRPLILEDINESAS